MTSFEQRDARDFHRKTTSDAVELALMASHHRPVGSRLQVDANGSVFTPTRSAALWMRWNANLATSWIVADRWLSTARLSHEWFDEQRTSGPTQRDQGRWTLSASLEYYVREATALRIGLEHRDNWSRGTGPDAPFNSHSYSRDSSVNLGVSRRFLGRFRAPGVLAGLGEHATGG